MTTPSIFIYVAGRDADIPAAQPWLMALLQVLPVRPSSSLCASLPETSQRLAEGHARVGLASQDPHSEPLSPEPGLLWKGAHKLVCRPDFPRTVGDLPKQ